MTDVHCPGGPAPRAGFGASVAEALATIRPDLVLVEGPPELDPVMPLAADPRDGAAGGGRSSTPRMSRAWPRFTRWRSSRRSGWRSAGPAHGVPVRTIDLPAAHSFALHGGRNRADEAESVERITVATSPTGPTRSRCWPRPPGTAMPSAGGRTPSSTARRPHRTVRGHYRGHRGNPRDGRQGRRTPGCSREQPARGGHAAAPAGRHARGPRADRRGVRRLPRARPGSGELSRRRRPTASCCRACPRPRCGHVGALDLGPAQPAQRLRRRCHVARLVPAPLRPLDGPGPRG